MKDSIGQDLKVGDIVAHGSQGGYSGSVEAKIVIDCRDQDFDTKGEQEVRVLGYNDEHWNGKGRQLNSRAGWTYPERVIVITDQVSEDLKNFLRSYF